MEEWLTTYEAAQLSGYHPNYIRRLLRIGEVRGRKWGQSWQVSQKSLLEYLSKVHTLGGKRGPKGIDK